VIAAVRERVAAGGSVGRAVADDPASGLSAGRLLEARDRSARDLLGAGDHLQGLLDDPDVTDVVVHACRVWADRGAGLEQVTVAVGDEEQVRALAVRLAALSGQRLDDAAPIVDGVLPGGTRLHAVLPPLAADGTAISLRPLRQRAFDLAALRERGMLPGEVERALRALVARRANVVVAGATGTGKTTLLSALLALVDGRERIVCIEEASELRPAHPHVVHLQTRQANVQAAGAVDLAGLVRAALRMRPDRIVLGEARGAEIREVLAALNTGHPGSWFTLHANSSADVPARLAGLGALAALDERAVAVQAAAALDAVVLLRRAGGTRVVAEVGELVASDGRVRVDVVLHGGQPTGEWAGFAARWLS